MNYFKKNLLRYILQWGVLAVIIFSFFRIFGNETFDSEAYCPFGGLQTLITYFSRGSMACSMTMMQIMMGVALAVGVILFGKFFCSYLCPLGLVNEVFVKIRRRLKIKQFVIKRGSVLDKCFRLIKYLLLFVIFYFTLSSSELFCKNFCPYYAFATWFSGELTVWMVSISIGILIIGGMMVDMFWCKYVCPLGALSNIFRFTVMFVAVILVQWILFMVGVNVPWVVFLGVIVVLGYFIEIRYGKAEYNVSLLHVHNNIERCNGCKNCVNRCPYHIEINKVKRVVDIDCNLCCECISACNRDALKMGICNTRPEQNEIRGKWIPPLVTILLFIGALYLGNKIELPTIDVKWLKEGVKESQLSSLEISGLRSVKCFGSSMAFKAQVAKVNGVYGVKTFVKNGKVVIYYLNNETNEEKIKEGIFNPDKFKINKLDSLTKAVKIITFRTENMYDKMDINNVGLQFKQYGDKYFGIETQYACPIIVKLYMDVNEDISENFIKEIVEKKELVINKGGSMKTLPCNYKFVKLESKVDTISVKDYLQLMSE